MDWTIDVVVRYRLPLANDPLATTARHVVREHPALRVVPRGIIRADVVLLAVLAEGPQALGAEHALALRAGPVLDQQAMTDGAAKWGLHGPGRLRGQRCATAARLVASPLQPRDATPPNVARSLAGRVWVYVSSER